MQKKVFQLLADNTSGVLSRISGLFSRRGYNIESITAGSTTNPRLSRLTIVASGEDEVLEQIEKQVAKLVDVVEIKELKPDESVYRELILVKVRVGAQERPAAISIADIFRAKIIDVAAESLIFELTGNQTKIDAFVKMLDGYEILEVSRTGIAGLGRGTEHIAYTESSSIPDTY
ncbi:MAG: acetolactate synthase small subunit [Acetatifactor sp.]